MPATPITPSIDKSLINYVRNKNKSKITALGNSTGNVHQAQMHGMHVHQVHQLVPDASASNTANVAVNTGVLGGAGSHSQAQSQSSSERLDKGSKMEIDGGSSVEVEEDKAEGGAPPLPSLTLNTLIPESNKSSSVGTDSQDVYMDVSG